MHKHGYAGRNYRYYHWHNHRLRTGNRTDIFSP